MQQIFINNEPKDNVFCIDGDDAHHLIKVVRIRCGEKIRVSTSSGDNFICEISEVEEKSLCASIVEKVASTELKNKIYLFQAIPKGDRMETIIEKCVELGVFEIIPVEMKNCIVKLDDKKKKNKIARYNAISKAAAEQSKRSIIPNVHDVMTFKEAIEYAKTFDIKLFPYENKNGMIDTYKVLDKINEGQSIAVFIGPEGGFDTSEVEVASSFMDIISLGGRILRTDTAAICSVSMLMLKCEEFN